MAAFLKQAWWAMAIRGVFAILFGLLAFLWPGITLLALVWLFGGYAIVKGVASLVGAVSGKAATGHRAWLGVIGVISIVAGILTFGWPALTALVLLYLIAARAVITGLIDFASAIALRREIQDEWLLALGGVAAVVFGIIMFATPLNGSAGAGVAGRPVRRSHRRSVGGLQSPDADLAAWDGAALARDLH